LRAEMIEAPDRAEVIKTPDRAEVIRGALRSRGNQRCLTGQR
jgi:hypothetical protein